MGRRRLTNQEFIDKANLVHSSRYDYSKADYQGNRNLVQIMCKVHGSFKQNAANHLAGAGCPTCGNISMRVNLAANYYAKTRGIDYRSKK